MQKILKICVIILVSTLSIRVMASEFNQIGHEESNWIVQKVSEASLISREGLLVKWQELMEMLKKNSDKNYYEYGDFNEDINSAIGGKSCGGKLRIFVSKSMGISLLKEYVKESKKYGAILVLNGFPDKGSVRKLAQFIDKITDGEDAEIQIDDEAFKRYQVRAVPTFILTEEKSVGYVERESSKELFDRVEGNIGIKGALNMFAEHGELSYLAKSMMFGAVK